MRNRIQIRKADWQTTEEGWQTEFACPVVYRGDLPWIEWECSQDCDFFLNGEFLDSRPKGSGCIRLEGLLRPGRNCLEVRGGSLPKLNLLITPKSHFRVPENGEMTLSCSCSWVPGSGILKVEADLMETCEGDTLRLMLRSPDGGQLDQVEVSAARREPVELVTPTPVLWEGVKAPRRMEVVAQLVRLGRVKDEVRLYTGMRTTALVPGRGLMLNGEPYPVKGRILQWEDDLADLKDQGYTAVWDRSREPAPWLLEECDRLGLIVFSDLGRNPWQKKTAQGHVSLCFWVRSPQAPAQRDATRLMLEPGQLQVDGHEFTI